MKLFLSEELWIYIHFNVHIIILIPKSPNVDTLGRDVFCGLFQTLKHGPVIFQLFSNSLVKTGSFAISFARIATRLVTAQKAISQG